MKITSISSGSHGNAYIVKTTKNVFLLEAGIRYSKIMTALDYKFPDAVLLTHCHGDHSKSILDFASKGVPVLCSKGTAEGMNLRDWQRGKFKDFDAMKLDSVHDCKEPNMFVIDDKARKERLFFVTDTETIPHKVDGITHLMLETNWSKFTEGEECVYMDRSKKTHLSLEEAVEWLEGQDLSKLQEVHLIHLSNGNSNEEYFQKTIAGIVGVPVYVC